MLAGARSPGASPAQENPCEEFYRVLEDVPHVLLARTVGPIEAIWPGETPPTCEISFETDDSTLSGRPSPDFMPAPDTDTYRRGWRVIPEILADGPGSGVYGIQRGDVRCVVDWAQPAYLDDDGSLVVSETFTMRLQCAAGPR